MVGRDASDEGDVFAGNPRAADLATRTTSPEQREGLAVPGDHGFGSDDEQGTLPVGPEIPKNDPEGAVLRPEPNPLLSPLVDGELLAKSRVLQGESRARSERRLDEAE
jgi:hypothetical protein